MLNMIRADFYRLSKTRGFWITQIVIVVFLLITISSGSIGGITIGPQDGVNQLESMYSIKWDGVTAVSAVQYMAANTFLYFILPLLVFVIGNDFSKETYKNILTVGVSRNKYFLSKITSFIIVLTCQLTIIYMISFITGSVLNGTGDVTVKFFTDTLKIMGVQILFLVAITIMSSLVLFMTKSNIISVISTLIIPMVIIMLHFFYPDVKFFEMIDFQTGFQQAMSLDFDLLKNVIIGAIGSIILGVVLIPQVFKHQEL